MPSRAEQRKKRQMEILVAALDLFTRKGYSATKIEDIAEAVGMSTGLMFHYYPSKEKLYEALIELGASAPNNMMAGVGQTEPLLFFEEMARQIFAYLGGDPFTAKMFVLMNQAQYSGDVPKKVPDMLKGVDYYTLCVPMIEAGQRAGTIRDGDPLALSISFWTAIQGMAQALALRPDTPIPDSRWFIDIIRKQ